jgi:hypothetical protein
MKKSHVLMVLPMLCALACANLAYAAETTTARPQTEGGFLWSADTKAGEADSYVAFRTTWELDKAGDVEFRLLGASWFVAWLDGNYFAEGPARFPKTHPQYQTYLANLKPGRHVLAVQVHNIGVPTRMLENLPPFLYATASAEGRTIPLSWKCTHLDGYAPQVRRINPQLGWIEWCDTRLVPAWQSLDFDDKSWKEPAVVARDLGKLESLPTTNPRAIVHSLKPLASGRLAETFGYERDDPAARFFLRDLDAATAPPQGVWRRYDLGRVRLARPRFVLDLPAGAVVEFGYAEYLRSGRVAPWITLSGGDSCNFDHYVARGGPQEFFPLTPKGGRFLEVHVLAAPDNVKFLKEEAVERCYYGEPDGSFHCGDEWLNRIWSVGVETHRACAEDTTIDNPTRERGQWSGDLVVGMDIAAVAFNDLRLFRRGLVQYAQCARQDGLVAGMCPGQDIFLSTFAAQWVSAGVHYWELTGDRDLLEQLFTAAERNLDAFEKQCTPKGLNDSLGWGFIDWGYVRNAGPSDMGVNLHYLAALRDMKRWCDALGKTDRAAHYQKRADELTTIIAGYFHSELAQGNDAWSRIGYHRAALGLRLGFFQAAEEKACVAFLKSHMLQCFPNDPAAPRLSDPGVGNPRLITPYFAHYVMPLLIERGEMDFALDQYRKCWGWALEDGRTTWLEVFDTRWSHCHHWAGCPTWQLSRYVLGLQPRYDLGERHYTLKLVPGSLKQASGNVPLGDTGKTITVNWTKTATGLHYRLTCPEPITLHIDKDRTTGNPRVVQIQEKFDETF